MKLLLTCTRISTNVSFEEVYTLKSSVFLIPEEAVPALRKMIQSADPDIVVHGAFHLEEVARGFYI